MEIRDVATRPEDAVAMRYVDNADVFGIAVCIGAHTILYKTSSGKVEFGIAALQATISMEPGQWVVRHKGEGARWMVMSDEDFHRIYDIKTVEG